MKALNTHMQVIMYNAMKINGIKSLMQVGIRDYCEEEEDYTYHSAKSIHVFYDELLYRDRLNGKSWKDQVNQIIDSLPENVYISFDADGMEPSLCPSTGTPVPGGLNFNEACFFNRRNSPIGESHHWF